ncbi:MAG: alkaline phosphatase family protein [Kiritimatiellae bacterium]|nr:alkaline phosphatase family protein [Kiritimatiellia bacterium]
MSSFADVPAAAKKPKALVIMLDGMRADAVENAYAPNLRMLRDGAWQPGYKCAWSLTANTILDAPTISGPNHLAIATGVTGAKTHQRGNEKNKCDHKKWPSWLVRLVDAKPEMKALFMYSWKWDESISPDPRVEFIHSTDAANAAAMPKRLAAADAPDAVQWYIDWPDHGGHGFGYYPYTTGYFNTVYLSDKAIGEALRAIASRPTFAEEDWLIIVTADHGGYHRSHGMMSGPATTIPFLVTSRHAVQGRMPGTPHNFYAAPTVLNHFGVDWAGMGLDGKVAGKAPAVVDPVRPLKDGLAAYLPFEDKTAENKVAGGPKASMVGTNATIKVKGGFIGGCLYLGGDTNKTGFVRLEGSEKLKFENGGEFAVALWVQIPKQLAGDPAIIGNKNWERGLNPGFAMAYNKDGVLLNNGLPGGKRHDLRPYDVKFGEWMFYAVTRANDGVVRFYQGGQDGHLYWMSENVAKIALATGLPFCLGSDGTGTYKSRFSGGIDDFALWTRTLSHDDVRRIYKAGLDGIPFGDLLK